MLCDFGFLWGLSFYGGGGLFECAFFLRSVLPEWVSSPDRWCFPNMGGLMLNNVLISVGVECIVLVTLLTVSDENLTHFVMLFFFFCVIRTVRTVVLGSDWGIPWCVFFFFAWGCVL